MVLGTNNKTFRGCLNMGGTFFIKGTTFISDCNNKNNLKHFDRYHSLVLITPIFSTFRFHSLLIAKPTVLTKVTDALIFRAALYILNLRNLDVIHSKNQNAKAVWTLYVHSHVSFAAFTSQSSGVALATARGAGGRLARPVMSPIKLSCGYDPSSDWLRVLSAVDAAMRLANSRRLLPAPLNKLLQLHTDRKKRAEEVLVKCNMPKLAYFGGVESCFFRPCC